MDLTDLSRKQKRLADWEQFLKAQVEDSAVRNATKQYLHQYKQVLIRCFETGQVSAADAQQLLDLERELEELNEQARLVVPKSVLPIPHSK